MYNTVKNKQKKLHNLFEDVHLTVVCISLVYAGYQVHMFGPTFIHFLAISIVGPSSEPEPS